MSSRHPSSHNPHRPIRPINTTHNNNNNGKLNSESLKLIYKSTDGTIDEYNLSDERISIGRLKTNTIHLTDPLVSGSHCEILNGFLLECGSTNGTTYNG